MNGQRTPAGEPAPKNWRQDHLIPLLPVSSSRFSEAGHDPTTNTLAIRFPPRKSAPDDPGPVYHYPNVTAEDYGHFRAAESLGIWFGHNILNNAEKHPSTRMWEGEKE